MQENKELGIKVAENSDEAFWENMREQCENALKAEARNIKINEHMLLLANKELS